MNAGNRFRLSGLVQRREFTAGRVDQTEVETVRWPAVRGRDITGGEDSLNFMRTVLFGRLKNSPGPAANLARVRAAVRPCHSTLDDACMCREYGVESVR